MKTERKVILEKMKKNKNLMIKKKTETRKKALNNLPKSVVGSSKLYLRLTLDVT